MKFAVCVLACVALALCVSAVDFQECGTPLFKPSSVIVEPNPPKIGGPLTVKVKGRSTIKAAGGTFKYKVESRIKIPWIGTRYISLDEGTDNICKYTKCPIKEGPVFVKYERELPSVLLPGTYRITVSAKDNKGRELLCVVFNTSIKSSMLVGAEETFEDYLGVEV